MTIRTVTYDDAVHKFVPLKPNEAVTVAIETEIDNQLTASAMDPNCMFRQDGADVYAAAIAATPPFTSLPNADLDVIGDVIDMCEDMLKSKVTDSRFYRYQNEEAQEDLKIVADAIAALKRIKGDA